MRPPLSPNARRTLRRVVPFGVIWFLVDHAGQALTRRQILDGAWGDGWIGDERTVDVHVRQLRRKLGGDLPLETVRGIGYRLG